MPMSFPDMNSLLDAAHVWKFRMPEEGESEQHYRNALADHVKPKDLVESQEIRTGKGWDEWNEREGIALLRHAGAMMTRAEHLAWAKERALAELERGDSVNAIASMVSDLRKHEELEGHPGLLLFLTARTPDEVRRWIEGFN